MLNRCSTDRAEIWSEAFSAGYPKSKTLKLSKNEIEMANRTREFPPRMQIAAALKLAVQGRPTIQQFVERLNCSPRGRQRKCQPRPGKMSGFSFSYDGIAFRHPQISS